VTNAKVTKDITNEIVSNSSSNGSAGNESSQVNTNSSADEEAVNRLAEKIDTMRIMGSRQLQVRIIRDDNLFNSSNFFFMTIRSMTLMNRRARLVLSYWLTNCRIQRRLEKL
jgi:hypothetical protein